MERSHLRSMVDEVGQIHCYAMDDWQPRIFSPQLVPPQLDYSPVVEWLEYCKLHHKRLCGSKEPQLSGLKVIDCNSLSVIFAPPSCSYVVLSYVWSQSNRDCNGSKRSWHDATGSLLRFLLIIIQEAVTVTKNLGLQYLWVDRFCINQNDPDEKHDQIRQMDVIYARAEITIIAAAGEDEDFGLPGAGAKPRRAQPTARVRNIQLVCSMMHPHFAIKSSKWNSRGWTYQEAVLSRRRLVFTEDQAYFMCNAMNCCESLRGDFDLLHAKNKYKSLKLLHSGILSGRQGLRTVIISRWGATCADTYSSSRTTRGGISLSKKIPFMLLLEWQGTLRGQSFPWFMYGGFHFRYQAC